MPGNCNCGRDSGRELRESAERLRLLVESVDCYAILMLDTEGRITSWNLGAQRIKGYTAQEILGRHFSVFYRRDDMKAGKCGRALAVAAEEGRFEDEGIRVRKDGATFLASVVIIAVRDTEGRLLGFGKVTRDLTARVQAEEERIRLAREGEQRTEEFLAVMGHELRNPLAPMLTATHLIKVRHGMHCEKEIAILERQLGHMLRLLDDLLDVSRIVRDKVCLSLRVMEIAAVLAEAVELASPLIEQRRHRLRLEIPQTRLRVDVDSERMTRVFANLLTNAAKYTAQGGEIRVDAEGRGDEVVVTVQDTGMGIAPDLMPHLFEIFTQGHETVDRRLGGLGIGLAVAARLVKEHGGRITAESEGPGRGSRFTVTLPRSRAAACTPVEERAMPPRRGSTGRRVLLVDDNEDTSETMRMLLESLGHEVRVAIDGPRGLEVAGEFQPDIAFLDIGLPGMSGFEVARRMRRIPAMADIPIVAISGYAGEADRKDAMKAGFSEHLAKPVDPARLEAAVDGALRRA